MIKKIVSATLLAAVLVACGNDDAKKTDSETATTENTTTTAPPPPPPTSGISTEDADKGLELIAKSDCLGCHKVEDKLVGPSYREVANKYPVHDTTFNYLAGKIIKGGAGVWGQVPMAPHQGLSQEDAVQMAKYVMSLKQ